METPHVPGFEILGKIRESGSTVTWRARQLSLDRVVALKFLNSEDAHHPDEVDAFLHVARAIAKLKQPNMVSVFDVVSTHEAAYVVMEYIDGQTIGEILRAEGRIGPRRALTIVRHVAEALGGAWTQAAIIHRNIKPDEITIDSHGTVRITDIGLATIASPGEDPVAHDGGMIVGTPNYISPEQAQGNHSIDHRADMYSLGATLYHMITGQAPFGERSPLDALDAQISDQIPHPRTLDSTLPFSICALICRLMMKLPADRYATWSEAVADMDRVLHKRHLHRQNPSGGSSTVATPVATEGSRARRTPGTPDPRRPPFLLRALLWLLLLVWLIWLADRRLREHAAPAAPMFPSPSPAEVVPVPDASPAPLAGPPSDADAARPVTPGPATPVIAATSLPAATLDALCEALRNEDLDALRAVLERTPPAPAEARAEADRMLAVIDTMPPPNRMVERAIMRHRGREITITHLGKARQVVPTSCVNGTLHVELLAAEGRRPVALETRQLSPDERLKWFSQAESTGEHASRCMLLLAVDRKQELQQDAAGCGALAPLFMYAARQ